MMHYDSVRNIHVVRFHIHKQQKKDMAYNHIFFIYYLSAQRVG